MLSRWGLAALLLVGLMSCGPDAPAHGSERTIGEPPTSPSTSNSTSSTTTSSTTTAPPTTTTTTTVAPTTSTTVPPMSGATSPGTTPPVVAGGPRSGNKVALTFDADMTPAMLHRLQDGRVASYANMAIVDILQRTDTPATIFFTGLWMERYPNETRRIAQDPRFELGTHSQTHRGFTPGCYHLGLVPQPEMADEVRRPIDTLQRLTGRATRYFRFPGLCHDPPALAAIAPAGVTVVDGDASGDAGAHSVEHIVRQTLDRAHPGSIIVLHLHGGLAGLTDEALPQIIDGLRAKGLQPTILSDVLVG